MSRAKPTGTTKTGRRRYFVRRSNIEGSTLDRLPEGFEFSENINGVVSVRQIREQKISESEFEVVQKELGRKAHLKEYKATIRDHEIIVHEPSESIPGELAELFGLSRAPTASERAHLRAHMRYEPVMKFSLLDQSSRSYEAARMSYRGDGGWLCLAIGTLPDLARKYLQHVGTDEFFELF